MAIGPQRIVCLTEEPTEVLYAIGEGEPGAFARCVEAHLAPASAAPGKVQPAPRTRDGSRTTKE
jgi:hypothetical protein